MLVQIVCILFLFPAALVCLYYVFLALFALISRKENVSIQGNPAHTFAIIIPAHNIPAFKPAKTFVGEVKGNVKVK